MKDVTTVCNLPKKFFDEELIDLTNGVRPSNLWLIEKIKKKEGWKQLSKKRRELLPLLAYYLGRNGKKPEPVSVIDLIPRENKGTRYKWKVIK